MDKQEFCEIMGKIAGAYMDERYLSERTLKAWFDVFKVFPSDVFEREVDIYISGCNKKPFVADLLSECKTRMDEINQNAKRSWQC